MKIDFGVMSQYFMKTEANIMNFLRSFAKLLYVVFFFYNQTND
jgi:hypothetical protein